MKLWLPFLLIVQASLATILEVQLDYPTIQAAMNASQPGDTVLVPPGTYHELMTTPVHDLSLVSRYIFSADSADISNTILDGELQGTILTLPEGEYQFELIGLTVKRGMGQEDWPFPGGGLWAQGGMSLMLQSCVYRENDTSQNMGLGSVLSAFYGNDLASLKMDDISIVNNNNELNPDLARISPAFFASCLGGVAIRNLLCDGAESDDACIYVTTEDSLSLDTLRVTGFHNTQSGAVVFGADRASTFNGVFVNNNRSAGRTLVGLYVDRDSGEVLKLNDVLVEQNSDSFIVEDNDISRAFVYVQASCIQGSDITVRNNRQLVGYSLSMRADVEGSVRNLHVHDNESGSDQTYQDIYMGLHVNLHNMSLVNAEFWRNVSRLPPVAGDERVWSSCSVASGYFGTSEEADTLVWENCSFRDNYIVNNTPQATLAYGVRGRTVYLRGLFCGNLVLRNCEWVNNRVNRIAPEVDLWPGPRNVGSTVELEGEGAISDGMNVIIEDCVFADNDDGGLFASNVGNGLIQRCQFVRNSRYGVWMYSNREETSVAMRNTFFYDVHMLDFQLAQPQYQGVFWIHAWEGDALIQNVSVVSCSTSYLASFGNEGYGNPQIENSCFSDNWFDQFVMDVDNTQDGEFSHCLAPFEIEGVGNVVGEATFDAELGVPYLDTGSLGIDQGNPEAVYQDVEDPRAPGFALWPSQGGLRNDIGFTGGPHAAVLDTSWVEVDPDIPDQRPDVYRLGNPYPNPFNPATRVNYWLEHPAEITIKVHNILGQEVASLVRGIQPAGQSTITIDGSSWASGVYLLTLRSAGEVRTKKLLVLK